MKHFEQFTKLYSLSKTLRFELKPIGKTFANIQRDGILSEDRHRADSYLKMKKIIDKYHKWFIDDSLSSLELNQEDLAKYADLYKTDKKSDAENKSFQKLQESLRKQIVAKLTKSEAYKTIFKKELLQNDLDKFLLRKETGVDGSFDDNMKLINEFYHFTSYFTGFHQNRENMYSDEEKSTAIGYRLIHENLPKFIDNIAIYKKIIEVPELQVKMAQLYKDFEEYLNVNSVDEIFCIDYYSAVLTQKQIAVYNMIIGGRSEKEGEKKIQGINEYVNLYNQQQVEKTNRLPKLKPLFKQILSDREVISWLPEAFETDNDVLNSIKQAYEDFFVKNEENICIAEQLIDLLTNVCNYSTDEIFIANDLQLTDISQHMTGSWQTIQNGLLAGCNEHIARKKKEDDEAYNEHKLAFIKSLKNLSLTEINDALAKQGIEKTIEEYFAGLGAVSADDKNEPNIFVRIKAAYDKVSGLLSEKYPKNKHLAQNEEDVDKIKTLLDAIKDLQRFVKPLLGNDIQGSKDERFYSDLMNCWNVLDMFTPLYSKVRNYLTKKPYSTEKIKLNFSNSQLLKGWDVNKEPDNTAVILRKDGLYYLAIMNKKHNKVFEYKFEDPDEACYEKMDYKLLPGPNKMLPKVFFSKTGLERFNPPQEILEIKKRESFKKGDNFNISECHKMIDFYKDAISRHDDWKKFGFKFSKTESYQDISGFYREVESQGYSISFRPVPVSYIDSLVDDGKIYLFQIYNKDFSEYSKGTPNMHTIYWKMLFDKRNIENVVYKLNGEAELFFREKSIDSTKPTHPANCPIENKNVLNAKKSSTFDYDLIKDRRYTVDKFLFHVPITMNFLNEGLKSINDIAREYIHNSKDLHIIGIDRGERHLLYLSVIDLNGNIKEQFSLNEIVNEHNGSNYTTNYHDLLERREQERDKQRKSWKTIETIKELKEGYLSQVIHKITQLMTRYNAIVVLEDLNLGFMRGRQKVEKQVYQKFEKMLIDKLNYLVDKNADADVPGGVLNALQLTNKVDALKDMGKQCGFLFYVPAWNTSKIDPVTGFANLFSSDDMKYSSVENSQRFFGKFDAIRYNADKDWFEFNINDYKVFAPKSDGTKQDWILCTYGTRIFTFRNKDKNSNWDSKEFDLTEAFKELFQKFGIDINGDLKESITQMNDKKFFYGDETQPGLCFLFKMMMQMRNSITNTETDYLISPVVNNNGNVFDSRNGVEGLPCNADANGAYNIARKGLMIVNGWKQISTDLLKDAKIVTSEKSMSAGCIDLTNKAYLRFIQQS